MATYNDFETFMREDENEKFWNSELVINNFFAVPTDVRGRKKSKRFSSRVNHSKQASTHRIK